MFNFALISSVISLIFAGAVYCSWHHKKNWIQFLTMMWVVALALMTYAIAVGEHHRSVRGEMHSQFENDLDLLAQACLELMRDEVYIQNDWELRAKDLVASVLKDERWNKQLKDGFVTSDGKDLWDSDLAVYRRNEGKKSWVVIESAGPDGDMNTKGDNISSVAPIPN